MYYGVMAYILMEMSLCRLILMVHKLNSILISVISTLTTWRIFIIRDFYLDMICLLSERNGKLWTTMQRQSSQLSMLVLVPFLVWQGGVCKTFFFKDNHQEPKKYV
jgi:hypothetical protein